MHKITKLKNGLRLITAPMTGTKTATVLVVVGTGSKYESRKISGISHFLEHLFFKGTKKRPTTLSISMELDAIGAEFNAFTGKEYTGYYVKSDTSKIETAMDVVSDMLLNSKFDAREIEREKGVIIEELNMYLDNPLMYIEDVFEQCLYGHTPAGRDTIGTKQTIVDFKRQDFVDYLNSQYSIDNSTVLLTGNFGNQAKAVKLVEKYFADPKFTKRGQAFKEKEAVTERQTKPQVLSHYKKTDQAHISLGVRTGRYGSKDNQAIRLLSIILGGSMSSRLFINLRERQGLAYYVRTSTESYSDCGYLTTRAGVPAAKIDLAAKTILKEYKRATKELVSPRELKRTKDLIIGRSAIQFEQSDNMAEMYAKQAVMRDTILRTEKDSKNLKIESLDEQIKKLKSVSTGQIRDAAKRIFVNKHLNLAVIGPFKDKKKLERLLKI